MDVYEATRVVLSRIQSLDPANASKIMGLLLLQDHGEKEMIRLAFGPQNLLHSVIAKAKKELDLVMGCSRPPLDSDFELLRSKSLPPRLAHHFTGASRFPFSPKALNLQLSSEAQRAAALMMMGDDSSGRWRPERLDLSAMACPASRQIYLTFPADSIFREEDVSNYFSTYGPVQDVRIPYQQKRMFGFVTFMYPETVKSILAKGNPHFVCDSRVLVKPYKEKGKVPDKYRNKPSPDSLDLHLGGRVFPDNTQDLLWRRGFEERALELQSTRLMNLQLLDLHKHFQLTSPNPPLDNSLRRVYAEDNVKGIGSEGSEEDTIKLPGSLEDRLPDSPFAAAADTNGGSGSGSSSPSFDTDESNSSALPDSFKSLDCQMPSLGVMGMLPGPTCRVGM